MKGLQPIVFVMQTAICFKTVVMMFLQTAVNKVYILQCVMFTLFTKHCMLLLDLMPYIASIYNNYIHISDMKTSNRIATTYNENSDPTSQNLIDYHYRYLCLDIMSVRQV